MKKLLSVLLAAGLLLASGCSSETIGDAPALSDSVKVVYDTVAVERGDVVASIIYDAYVLPVKTELKFDDLSGTVEEVYVKAGDSVAAGDALLRLNTEDLEERLENAETALASLEEAGKRDRRLLEIALEFAELNYEEFAEIDASSVDAELAALEVRRCEASIEEYDLNYARSLSSERESVETLRAEIAASTLRAPNDGEVLSVYVSDGARVSNETKLIDLSLGADSYLHVDGSKRIATGEIFALIDGEQISVEKWDYTDNELAAFASANRTAPNRFLRSDGAALPALGEYIQLTVVRERSDNTLRIPANALWRDSGINYVYLVDGEERVYTPVQVGVTNDAYVEILGGVGEGDIVYVGN